MNYSWSKRKMPMSLRNYLDRAWLCVCINMTHSHKYDPTHRKSKQVRVHPGQGLIRLGWISVCVCVISCYPWMPNRKTYCRWTVWIHSRWLITQLSVCTYFSVCACMCVGVFMCDFRTPAEEYLDMVDDVMILTNIWFTRELGFLDTYQTVCWKTI